MTFADGTSLDQEDELALIQSRSETAQPLDVTARAITMSDSKTRATVELILQVTLQAGDPAMPYRYTLDLACKDGGWKAVSGRGENLSPPGVSADTPAQSSLRARISGQFRRLRSRFASPEKCPVHESNYLPYRAGESFLLPPRAIDRPATLPIPPQALWLGYNYPAHGKLHVDAMMKAVEASGLTLRSGDRILDLGCGAGRMIRHLEPLARDCEIWGTDISSEHIFWCREHLSPPFNFATTTKIPSLPFEDRSFALIYCGSLFTHIDDLADAWLLELHRLLAPGGRAYVTIHDNHTMKLFDEPNYGWSPIVRSMKADPLFEQARAGFGMFSLGRDNQSQVFYDRAFFTAMTDRMFETSAIVEEAYFYQTAHILKRRTLIA